MALFTEQMSDFTFSWKVENFNFSAMVVGSCLESPEFEVQAFESTSWYLRYYPREDGCCLCRTLLGPENISITYRIELVNDKAKCIASSENVVNTFKKHDWGRYIQFDTIQTSHLRTITIHCFMSQTESAAKLTTKCKARTKFGVDRYCFRWRVKMFEDPSWIKSKILPFSITDNVEVTLSVPKDTLNISVRKVKGENNASYHMTCELSLLDVKGIRQESDKYAYLFNRANGNDTWEFLSFLTKDKLVSGKRKFLKDGNFTLMFDFSVSNGNDVQWIEGYYHKEYLNSDVDAEAETVIALQEDLQQLLETHLQSDVNLRAENQTFPAHKLLLTVRSPVFAAMFQQNMLENQTGMVNIPDVEAEILKCFLRFLYTGIVDTMNYEYASELLIVADKYQVPSLKEKCSSFLMSNLTTENACDIVMLADMIEHEALKACAVEYITDNAETILSSDHWTQCIENNLKLATNIFRKLVCS